jgi:membrane protease YdiL (CAAX protease family)
LVLKKRIAVTFSARHIALALLVSLAVLLPFFTIFSAGKRFVPLGIGAAAFQLFGVSFPEEVFFRGFLQEAFGNNLRGVMIVSFLFAAAHLPGLIFYGDIYAPLTFLPSIIMGLLYMRTSNIVPPTIFHFLSNVVYLGSL